MQWGLFSGKSLRKKWETHSLAFLPPKYKLLSRFCLFLFALECIEVVVIFSPKFMVAIWRIFGPKELFIHGQKLESLCSGLDSYNVQMQCLKFFQYQQFFCSCSQRNQIIQESHLNYTKWQYHLQIWILCCVASPPSHLLIPVVHTELS